MDFDNINITLANKIGFNQRSYYLLQVDQNPFVLRKRNCLIPQNCGGYKGTLHQHRPTCGAPGVVSRDLYGLTTTLHPTGNRPHFRQVSRGSRVRQGSFHLYSTLKLHKISSFLGILANFISFVIYHLPLDSFHDYSYNLRTCLLRCRPYEHNNTQVIKFTVLCLCLFV